MKKRVFSLILALIFSIGLLPAAALAEGTESGAAQIGKEVYPTLPDAVNAAQDGDTIQLLADSIRLRKVLVRRKRVVSLSQKV